MKGGYSFVQENNSEKHVVYNSVSLIVPILNALAINYRSHPIHSITVHHVPHHVVLAAYQTRILLNGFRFPTSHSLLSDLPKSRLHVVVFVIQNRAAPMAHEQLIHVGLGTPRVGTLDQFPQFERVQLVMGRIISQMLQQVVLVAVAAIARHASCFFSLSEITFLSRSRSSSLISSHRITCFFPPSLANSSTTNPLPAARPQSCGRCPVFPQRGQRCESNDDTASRNRRFPGI